MTEAVAILATIVLTCLAAFQLLLALGLPLGKMAWGGAHAVLPVKLRVASASSIILYAFFAFVVLNQANVVRIFSGEWVGVVLWALVVYFFVGILMNTISRSKQERIVMTPTAAVLALTFLYVALS